MVVLQTQAMPHLRSCSESHIALIWKNLAFLVRVLSIFKVERLCLFLFLFVCSLAVLV